MEYVVTIFGLISFVALLALIGLIITWIIGTRMKNKSTNKVGKLGTICTAITVVVSFGIASVAENRYEKNLADNRRTFREYAGNFRDDYYSAASSIEDASNAISDDWYDALGSDNMETLVAASTEGQPKTSVKKDLKHLKVDITMMKINDTGDLDMSYKDFQKAYDELYRFYSLTYYPTGESYASYRSKTSKYDESVAKHLSKIESFTR